MMKQYAIWGGYFAATYLGIWGLCAFMFWQTMPEDNSFFRIIVIPAAFGAVAIHHLRKLK